MQVLPKTVTHNEIALVYGLTERQAQYKLTTIRAALGKKRTQHILIAEFCTAENIDRKIFETELQQSLTQLQKH
jgi:hypothetical protein